MRKRVAATAQQRERLSLAERNARLLQELREKRYSEWKQELDREIESAATESWVAANYRQSKP